MRILSALTYYYPHWTGLTAHAQLLAEGLAARGHAVTVLAYRSEPGLAARAEHNGVGIERAQPWARISRGMVGPDYLITAARLVRAADVVLINTPMLESLALALLAARYRRPCIMVHHGDLVMPGGFGHQLVERGVTALMNGTARRADWVTTYSEDYGRHSRFLGRFAGKLVAIPPPIQIPTPDRRAAAEWRHELGLSDRRVIGFAGRFVEEKGADVLLRAMPILLKTEPEAHLIYAGDAHPVYERFYERCQPLIAALAGHFTELGLLRDRQRLADFYAMCDVFALPSRSDCFASVQAEAMLCGTPVVASDIPGAREAVRLTGMGTLVPALDPAALARGLATVVRDRGRYLRSHDDLVRIFDRTRVINAYEDLLRGTISAEALKE
jgi:glycosyltransferase involved in cell wall biosynthesis